MESSGLRSHDSSQPIDSPHHPFHYGFEEYQKMLNMIQKLQRNLQALSKRVKHLEQWIEHLDEENANLNGQLKKRYIRRMTDLVCVFNVLNLNGMTSFEMR